MYGLAQVYNCCRCGETWRVSSGEVIDTENDRVETCLYCDVCGSEIVSEKKENGIPCLHAITEEEHLQLSGFYDTQDKDDEEFNDTDF
jgi:DNA-directed RNA polymerase subunit RPC12/RpoP